MVTLGRHDTEATAKAEAEKFRNEQHYREVAVERIEPAPDSPAAES